MEDLERVMNDAGACKALVERHGKPVFGFILSFASFSREQAFEIAVSSFVDAIGEMQPIPGEGAFLESLFRRVVQEFGSVAPSGDAGLSAFGELPPQKRESLKIVRNGFLHLSKEDKLVLLLRDQCHFSFERIAGILTMRQPQARSACLAARERLRKAVQDVLERKAG